MMFTKHTVIKITAVLPEKKLSGFITELGISKLVHLEKELHESLIESVNLPKYTADEMEEAALRIFAETDYYIINYNLERNTNAADSSELKEIFSQKNYSPDIERISYMKYKTDQYERLKNEIKTGINAEEKLINDKLNTLNLIKHIKIPEFSGLCTHILGTIEPPDYDITGSTEEYFIQQNGALVSAIVLAGHELSLKNTLESFSFSEITESADEIIQIIKHHSTRQNDLQSRLNRIEAYYKTIRNEFDTDVVMLNRKFSIIKKIIEARKSFSFSSALVVFDGWIRQADILALDNIFQRTCGNDYYLETGSQTRPESRPPTVLKNNSFFKPFEILVTNIGVPENSEYDPTPFAAVSFCIMFGVMFGDAGQGLTLFLAGLLLKTFSSRNSFLFNGGHILMVCGMSALIFGFMYGSLFSNEHILPPLLFHPMEDMMKLFAMAIIMGVTFISAGMIFHIITCLNFNDKEEAFFGAKGIPGLLLYSGIITLLSIRLFFNTEIHTSVYLAVICVPLALFALRNVLAWFFLNRTVIFPSGLFEYTVETLVEIIEMFSSFIGNTISFIRAGAFALSHAGLSMAVYTLAGILNPDPQSASYILTAVIGNVFIIFLEGLVCTIQSMRLEYYEIFSKFFHGGGRIFSPFSLDLNNSTGGHS